MSSTIKTISRCAFAGLLAAFGTAQAAPLPVTLRGDATPWTATQPVSGTDDPSRYAEQIYGAHFSAVVQGLPEGLYTVEVFVAEQYWGEVNKRVFTISSGGTTLAANLDLYATAGKNREHVVGAELYHDQVELEILFDAQQDNAVLNALAVWDADGALVASYHVSESVVGEMRALSPQQVVEEMGIGTNLGNTLDVRNANKTYWGNPETTEAIIDGILSRGYGTLRLPVTWEFNMGSAPDYIIEQTFLNRVGEIADWALDNNVYVIINTHHDGDWIVPTYAEIDATTNQLYKVWTQIAAHFKNYGDHLIFETLNEPRVEGGGSTWGEWSGGTPETRDCVNIANKACVDAIRATGGNNALRKIMVPTHAANAGATAMNAWVAPNNDTNVIVSLHAYSPYWFCLTDQDPDWGTAADEQDLDTMFTSIYNTFVVGQGRAVVMGEWGEQDNGLGNEADRARHAQYYAQACIDHGICPVYWDDGGKFKVYDRYLLSWHAPTHADAILSPYFGVPFDLYALTEELQLGRLGDDDGDGENNFLEFATGGDAVSAAVQGRPVGFQVLGNGTAVLTSSQRIDRDLIDLRYTVEWTDDLTTNAWQTLAAETIATNAVPGAAEVEELQQRFSVGAGTPTNRFIRLRVDDVATP